MVQEVEKGSIVPFPHFPLFATQTPTGQDPYSQYPPLNLLSLLGCSSSSQVGSANQNHTQQRTLSWKEELTAAVALARSPSHHSGTRAP